MTTRYAVQRQNGQYASFPRGKILWSDTPIKTWANQNYAQEKADGIKATRRRHLASDPRYLTFVMDGKKYSRIPAIKEAWPARVKVVEVQI